jgi:hypothetical protein
MNTWRTQPLALSIQPRLTFAAWSFAAIGSLWWLAWVPDNVHPYIYIVCVIGGGALPVIGALSGVVAAVLAPDNRRLLWSIAAVGTNLALSVTFATLMFPNTRWW